MLRPGQVPEAKKPKAPAVGRCWSIGKFFMISSLQRKKLGERLNLSLTFGGMFLGCLVCGCFFKVSFEPWGEITMSNEIHHLESISGTFSKHSFCPDFLKHLWFVDFWWVFFQTHRTQKWRPKPSKNHCSPEFFRIKELTPMSFMTHDYCQRAPSMGPRNHSIWPNFPWEKLQKKILSPRATLQKMKQKHLPAGTNLSRWFSCFQVGYA